MARLQQGTGNLRVEGIRTPTADTDAANKAYVDQHSVDSSLIDDNSVGAAELNVSGNGTSGQALISDGDGTFSWGSPTAVIADDSVTEAKLDISNTPANTEFLGYFGNEMVWVRGAEGVVQTEYRRETKTGSQTDVSVANGRFGLYSSASGSGGIFLSANSNLNTAAFVRLSTIDYIGTDVRAATGRLKNGSIVRLERDGSNYIIARLGNAISGTNIRAISTILESAGTYGDDSTNWNVDIRSSSFNATDTNDFVPGAVDTAAIGDAQVTGQKLNVTEINTGTTRVLSRNEDSGVLEEGAYSTFSSTVSGIVPLASSQLTPRWDVLDLDTTLKTDVLVQDLDGNFDDGDRAFSLGQNGAFLTSRPASWQLFAGHSGSAFADDQVRMDDAGGTFGNKTAVLNYLTTGTNAGTQDITYIAVSDHNNWAVIRAQQVDGSTPVITRYTTSGSTEIIVVNAERLNNQVRHAVVHYEGVPGPHVQFFFPFTVNATAITGQLNVTGAAGGLLQAPTGEDNYLNPLGTWVALPDVDLTDPDTVFAVWKSGSPIAGGLVYNSSNLPELVRKEVVVDDRVYNYTSRITYNSNNLPTTVQVYNGDFTTVASLLSTHLLATKTITYNSSNLPTGTTIS